jgi:hypothetical protein
MEMIGIESNSHGAKYYYRARKLECIEFLFKTPIREVLVKGKTQYN